MDYVKTESFFKNAGVRYNKPGPYLREIRFESMCRDPVTKEYYQYKETKEVEEENEDTGEKQMVLKDILVPPKVEYTRVKRVFNLADKKEYILTEGYRYAGNSYHEIQSCDINEPEMYLETKFNMKMQPHPTIEGQTQLVRTGNTVTIERYTLPYDRDVLENIMKKARPDVELIVKEIGRGGPKLTIYDYEQFKNLSFDELYYKPLKKHGEGSVQQRDTRSSEDEMIDPGADATKNEYLNPEVRQKVNNLPSKSKGK